MKRAALLLAGIAWFVATVSPADADVCNRRFPVTVGGDTLYQRYCANADITVANDHINRVIFVIQSSSINADDYCAGILGDLQTVLGARALNSILVVCPHFLSTADEGQNLVDEFDQAVGGTWSMCTTGSTDDLYYTTSSWKEGNESLIGSGESCTARAFVISTFEVLDQMLAEVVSNMPNIRPRQKPYGKENIIFTGQSAGGQMVNRYPGYAQLPAGFTMDDILWWPVNPSAYLFVTDVRPDVSQSVTWPIVLDVPADPDCNGAGPTDTDESDYNDYPDGLASISGTYDYIQTFNSADVFAQFSQARMALGHELSDNYDNGDLATDCGAWLQNGQTAASGLSRLHRGHGWFEAYLDTYGYRDVAEGRKTFIFTDHGTAHGGLTYWASECAAEELWRRAQYGRTCGVNPTIQRDLFDGGDLSYWTASGTGTVAISGEDRNRGAGAARFEPGSSAKTLTAPQISGAGVYTVAMMLRNHPLVATGEGFVIEANEDGGGWVEVADLDGDSDTENEWIAVGFSSGILSTSYQVRVKFTSAAGYGYLDDFIVLKRTGVESTP